MPERKPFGKYDLLAELGHGGFATVYRARDTKLDREVALKVLHPVHTADPALVERFRHEAQQAARLHHPNIVHIYEVDVEAGQPYIVMEYLPGGALTAHLMPGAPWPWERACPVLQQVAAALDHAHKKHLLHRDVKPANILFDEEERRAVLVDFGLVKSLLESGLTAEGTRLGTPAYMAPEQADGGDLGPAVDIYALGIVAYELLTGRAPFVAETPVAVLLAQMHTPPPDPCERNPALPAAVAAVLLKALAKAPAERYASAGQFVAALQSAFQGHEQSVHAQATLAEQYAQAQAAAQTGDWGQVTTLCFQLRAQDPDYPGALELLAQAAAALAQAAQLQQRARELEQQHTRALQALAAGRYAQAARGLRTLQQEHAPFADLADRLAAAENGVRTTRLYRQVLKQLQASCPDAACAALLELLRCDPAHAGARERLPEALAALLAQYQAARSELATWQARGAELAARLKTTTTEKQQAQAALAQAHQEQATLQQRVATLEAQLHPPVETPRRGGSTTERGVATPTDDRWICPVDGKAMVRIPAGEFLYGDRKKKVTLPEYWIDVTPVTNAEYARFVAVTGHEPPTHWKGQVPPQELENHPVVNVSLRDAMDYAAWAGKRLPSEQEWEKAARGTDGRKYPWGNAEPTANHANYGKSAGETTPVGRYSPAGDSPYGCVDLAGNVWEWTASDYDKDSKVLRGGSWYDDASRLHCANRLWLWPATRIVYQGFRCVLSRPGV